MARPWLPPHLAAPHATRRVHHMKRRREERLALDIVEASKSAIRGHGLRVALPEPEDERILRAAARLSEAGLARPVLIGKAEDVDTRAAAAGVKLDGCEVRDPGSDATLAGYAAHITAGREKMTAGMAER